MDHEDDLRAGLRALTVAAPPQPAARAEAAIGRAHGIRRRRAGFAAVAVLLPAVAAGAVLARPAPARPLDYANVATWPDRSDPAVAALRRAAFDDWDRSHDVGPDEQPRWLWAGRVRGTDDVVVAFAVCAADACSRAVVMRGEERKVRLPSDDPHTSPWIEVETRDLGAGRPMAPLSAYLSGPRTSEDGPRTVLFVLAAPDAAAVAYTSPEVAGRGGVAGELVPAGGAFVGDVGYLAAHVTISVRDDRGRVVHTGGVGDADAHGQAVPLDGDVDLPRGYEGHGGSGQLGHDGFSLIDSSRGTEPHALFVRCRGGAPLRVEMNGVRGSVPCDGRTHRATPLVEPELFGFDEGDELIDSDDDERPAFHYRLRGDDPYTVFQIALAKRV